MLLKLYEWNTRRRSAEVSLSVDKCVERGLVRCQGIDTVEVRQMRAGDHFAMETVRGANVQWLAPWDASVPPGYPTYVPDTATLAWNYARDIRHGRAMPLKVSVDGQLVGSIVVMSIVRGAAHNAQLGYWIAREWAGQGIMTLAVAMAMDICFDQMRLHRLEINVRPENEPSRRLVRRLGLRNEGLRRRFLHVGSQWCDHVSYAMTAEEKPAPSLVAALESGKIEPTAE